MPLSTGQMLNNRYRIVRLLGQGGFGAVYRAWDLNLEAPCAVKENLDATPEAQLQFKREAQILFSLSHPNLPRVMDHFVIPGQGQYLVMEFVEGDDLQTLLGRQPNIGGHASLNEAQSITWVLQICDALNYLHTHHPPVIHRDIKPANIKITPQGKAMLVDFGIAKIFDPGLATTRGARAVTPGYSPPEQYGKGLTDGQSDIYALGATLYTLLTGEVPPPSVDLLAGAASLPTAAQINPSISPVISNAISAAMQVDRTRRTRSALEFRQALTAAGSTQAAPPNIPYPGQTYARTSGGTVYAQPQQEVAPASFARTMVTPGAAPQSYDQYTAMPQPAAPPSKMDALRALTKSRLFWPIVGGIAGLVLIIAIASALLGSPEEENKPTQEPETSGSESSSGPIAETSEPVSGSMETGESRIEPLPVIPVPQPASSISASTAASVIELARFGRGHLYEVSYSPDGSLVAAAGSIGLYIFDASALDEVRYIDTGYKCISTAFAPDGQSIAVGLEDNTAKLYEVSSGQLVRSFVGHSDSVNVVLFSPDGSYLATASDDTTIIIYQVSDGSQAITMKGHSDQIWGLAYSADGSRLASASHDNTARLWDAASGEELQVFNGHSDHVWAVDITSDGSRVVTGSADKTLKVWDAIKGSELATLEAHTDAVYSVDISPDGKLAASASGDLTIRLWDLSSYRLKRTLEGHDSAIATLEFAPDGQTLSSAASNGDLNLWRTDDGMLLIVSPGGSASFYSVAFSPNGQMFAAGDTVGKIRLYNASDGSLLSTLVGHTDTVWDLSFSPDSNQLASASSDASVRLWDVQTGVELWKMTDQPDDVFSVAFSPTGDMIASASNDGTIRLRNPATGEQIDTLAGEGELSLAWSPDGAYIASGSTDNTVHFWNVNERKLIAEWPGHTDAVYSVAYSPDGAWVGSASPDKTVRIWRTDLGGLVYTLEWHTDTVENVAFSPDSTLLASASADYDIILWRVSPGEMLWTLEGHTDRVIGLAFSLDGRFLASGSEDGTIRLWGAR